MEKYQAKIDGYSTNWCVIFKASELRELRNGWERLWERETYSMTAKHKPRLSKEFLTLKESWQNLKETLKLNGRCRPIRVPDFDSCSKIEKCLCFQNVYILSSCRKSKNKLATHCLSCVRNLGEPVKTEPWYWGLGVESSPYTFVCERCPIPLWRQWVASDGLDTLSTVWLTPCSLSVPKCSYNVTGGFLRLHLEASCSCSWWPPASTPGGFLCL